MSTLGNWSRPSLKYPAAPTTTTSSINTDAKTGRWTQTLASHCTGTSLHGLAVLKGWRRLLDHPVARLHAAHDGDEPARGGPGLDDALLDPPVDDGEDALAVVPRHHA